MGDIVFTILVFVGVISVTALLFGGWLIVTFVRFAQRALGSRRPPMVDSAEPVCPNPGCRASSPTQAKFCRRCGSRLAIAQSPAMTPGPVNRKVWHGHPARG